MASTTPRFEFSWVVQQGEKAYLRGTHERAELEARLPPGLLEGLRADLDGLTDQRAAPVVARTESRAATAAQNDSLGIAHRLITGIRLATRKSGADAETRKAFGVGATLRPDSVTQVVAAGTLILERARQQPQEARAIGILETDLGKLRTSIASVQAADGAQEKVIAAKPLKTAEKNRVGRRIFDSIRRISAAGVLAFALDETRRAEFDVLDDLPKKPAKKKPS